jgi:phosphatidyl-myo-inositol dimannoside synthase
VSTAWSRAIVMTPRCDGADGVSAVTRLYAEALSARLGAGVGELEIWTLDGAALSPSEADARVRVRHANGSRARFATFGVGAASIDERTLVVVQHVHLLPVALPLAWRGARLLVVLHGVEAWTQLRTLERAGCRAAWKIAAVSAHTAARFRTANPEFRDREIEICAPGRTAASGDVRGDRRSYALIVGRMSSNERYKGHDSLIDVWPAVRRAVPEAQLVIAGGGDDQQRLAEKAASLGLAQAVRFEGIVSDERLADLYRGAALFVMPSPNEGFGLVYIEAMAAGTPCIVSTGAAEEIVEHERTGVVVTPGDADALTQAIVRLMTRHAERDRMGAAAAHVARQRFSPAAFAGRLYNLLQLPGVSAAC